MEKPRMHRDKAKYLAGEMVVQARKEALAKHGPLQGGMQRWRHHLVEETIESINEMRSLQVGREDGWPSEQMAEVRARLGKELAQVVQLATEMLILLLQQAEFEGEETWKN